MSPSEEGRKTHSSPERELSFAAIEEDGSRKESVGCKPARKSVEQGWFSGARGTHEGGDGSRLGIASKPLQNLLGLPIAESHHHRQILPCQPGRHVTHKFCGRLVPPKRLAQRTQSPDNNPVPCSLACLYLRPHRRLVFCRVVPHFFFLQSFRQWAFTSSAKNPEYIYIESSKTERSCCGEERKMWGNESWMSGLWIWLGIWERDDKPCKSSSL